MLCVFSATIVTLPWNPVISTEFMTASQDGSVRVWRVSIDDGIVAAKMLWGTNLRRLCTECISLERATGLSSIYQTLLVQRRAFSRNFFPEDGWVDELSDDDDPFGSLGDDDEFDDGSEVDNESDDKFEDDDEPISSFGEDDGSEDEG